MAKHPIIRKVQENAVSGLVTFMLSAGAVFFWQRGGEIWRIPESNRTLMMYHKQDSMEREKWKKSRWEKEHRQDSINSLHWDYIKYIYYLADSVRKTTKKRR